MTIRLRRSCASQVRVVSLIVAVIGLSVLLTPRGVWAQGPPEHPSVTVHGQVYTPRSILARNMGSDADQTTAFMPHKVIGNIYYVGTRTLSTFLIVTPQGNILFDTSQEPFVDMIEANIKKIGVDPHSIKYIILNHGHTDHFGGAKRLQEFTGARVMATPEDWKMIEATAGKPNNRDNNKPTDVPKHDMDVHEGDHIDLGDQHLIVHTAPGHTPGNLFIEGLVLHDGAQTYRGIWGGGGLGAPGLAGAEQGVKNAEKLNAVKGIQVYVMTHAWQDPNGYPGGGVHERAKKLAMRKPGDPHPFVDPATWDARAKRQLEQAKKVLADEQAKASATKKN